MTRFPWCQPTPLKLNLGDGIVQLPDKSTIKLHTLSGDAIDESCGLPKKVISKPGDNAELLTKSWALSFAAHTRVPVDDCISFSWSCDGDRQYKVSIVFLPLSDARHIELLGVPWERCSVCGLSLSDQDHEDDLMDGTTCKKHCSKCRNRRPDTCNRCKVILRGGKVKCYFCLTKDEFEQAKVDHPTESLRLNLLLPGGVPRRLSRSSSKASAQNAGL